MLSEGDAEYVDGEGNLSQMFGSLQSKKQHPQQPDANTKEEPCNVCFEKSPDAVLMSCGHGGLCYGCALDIWKKSINCFFCKKVIITLFLIA